MIYLCAAAVVVEDKKGNEGSILLAWIIKLMQMYGGGCPSEVGRVLDCGPILQEPCKVRITTIYVTFLPTEKTRYVAIIQTATARTLDRICP